MRVGVTGATGFVGNAIVSALAARGDEVVVLTRRPDAAHFQPSVKVARFDVNDPTPNPNAIEGLDGIIHLAGEIVDGRWTKAKKQAIFSSRVDGTRNLVSSIEACAMRPRVLVSASAVGFYGDRGDEPLDDFSPPGDDFLASVCVGWEREARAAQRLGLRVASVRVSMVFGHGGAVGKLVPIFKWGVGGPMGSGHQWMPWIHIDDMARLFLFALDRDDLVGPIAGVAPDYVTNHRFALGLGRALGVPAIAPAPGVALRAIVGEFAETLLGGQLIIPARALDAGFVWHHPTMEEALIDVVAPARGRSTGISHFSSKQTVPAGLDDVFAFFSDPSCLARLTPPAMQLRREDDEAASVKRGSVVNYSLRVRGVRMRWRALIDEWKPKRGFSDVQIRGPYAMWRHVHGFAPAKEGGTEIDDRIDYALPFAPASNVLLPLIRRDIDGIFAYRRRVLQEVFGDQPMRIPQPSKGPG
jgi:uncharacterized protein